MKNRKDDHLKLALNQQLKAANVSRFNDVRFIHHSFNQTDFSQLKLSTEWAGKTHDFPFFINGMTGGSERALIINRKLAQLAAATGLAMASGSVSVALKDPSALASFRVIREENPNGFVMANLGAHHGIEQAWRAVEILQADALQIHLNIPQEVVMPEGDRNFASWFRNIEEISKLLPVPVIVKEVGFGMSRETIELLISLGVQTIDVGGRGGTNFLMIENERRDTLDFSHLQSWGQTTPESLIDAHRYLDRIQVLASGGIQDFVDVAKALAMGARGVGLAGVLLKLVETSSLTECIDQVNNWKEGLRLLMLMLGCQTIDDLRQVDLMLTGDLADWLDFRNLPRDLYVHRF